MRRVLTNIIDNSCKYMNKDSGIISVFLRETGSQVIIELRDNGRGLDEKDAPLIFDRFFRADASRGETKGSGLGLAIAKQIVESHNGRIWALSHGAEGTRIMISLPQNGGFK
jgi:signal transduction histidine kinase